MTATDFSADPIAIIGMSCRFPGANDIDAFWDLLCDGRDAITEIPADRWDIDRYYDPDPSAPGKMVTRRGGFLDDIHDFDAQFFGISPREAGKIDPRQRLALELTWEALEHADIRPRSLAGSRAGVFVGTLGSDFGTTLFADNRERIDAYSGPGCAHSVVANRVSYFLDLQGPSISVDTACSGALTALHVGCHSLYQDNIPLALVGGFNIILRPDSHIFFSKAGALAPDGRCKTFDKRANGIARSEGAGMLVLKRLSQAVEDGDRIIALIRGSALNQDGRSNGIMAPNRQSQEAVLTEAYESADISPRDVQYVEAHGTGTSIGDPIEVQALGAVLGADRSDDLQCALGSVKTNIGHTEPAAGVAGVIKVALAIQHRMLPPTIHFEEPNPLIDFDALPFYVQQTLGPWPDEARPLIAGVSSFGIGGSNAHVVLSDVPATEAQSEETVEDAVATSTHVLPLSARKSAALRELADRYHTCLIAPDAPTLSSLCYTAGTRREQFEHRLACVAGTREELAEQLRSYADGEVHPNSRYGTIRLGRSEDLVFVFSGQGTHWPEMGRDLLEKAPAFRDTLEACDERLGELVDYSLIDLLTGNDTTTDINDTEVAQPAIFAIQVALAALWRNRGVVPDVIVGQSLGEVAAAHVAGALSLSEAVSVVVHRSRLMKSVAGRGKTAVVGLPMEQAKLVLTGFDTRLSVAGSSSPQTSVLSGDPDALDQIIASLQQQGIFCRALRGVDIAFHSPHMDPLKETLREALQHLEPRQADIRLVSSVTATEIEGAELDAEYWGRNLREPFLFSNAVQYLVEQGYCNFLEVSPHAVLTSPIQENLAHLGEEGLIVSSMLRDTSAEETMAEALATLYTNGHEIDWSGIYPEVATTSLPTYPWQREYHWFVERDEDGSQRQRYGHVGGHPLLGVHRELAFPPGEHLWENALNANSLHYLDEHRVQGITLLPGTAYLEMALSAADEVFADEVVWLENVRFEQAFFLPDDTMMRDVQVVMSPEGPGEAAVQVFSSAPGVEAWQRHMQGSVRHSRERRTPATTSAIEQIRERCREPISGEDHYAAMTTRGLEYGPSFQAVSRIWRRDSEALARIDVPATIGDGMDTYRAHPVVLDAGLQVVATTVPHDEHAEHTYLPIGVDEVAVYGAPTEHLWCHVQLRSDLDEITDTLSADVRLVDDDGTVLVTISGLQLKSLEPSEGLAEDDVGDWLYEISWEPRTRQGDVVVQPAADYVPPLSEVNTSVAETAAQLCDEFDLDNYAGILPELERVSALHVIHAFRDLGVQFAVGDRFTTSGLQADLDIVQAQAPLFRRLLDILEEEQVLDRVGDEWVVRRQPTTPDFDAEYEALTKQYPPSTPELTLLRWCGDRLAGILDGTYDPLEVLFPDGSSDMAESFYTDALYLHVYNRLLQASIEQAIAELPDDRMLHMLEIGAGTGSTTEYVLPALPAKRTQYTFTDIGNLFLINAEEKFTDVPFMDFRQLDIEVDPETQGFMSHQYDCIIAANVLHATSDLRRTLEHIKQLLVPEGILVLLEGPGPQRWMDITFGTTEGWWHFTDEDIRPNYPLLSGGAEWQSLLAETGFTETTVVTEPSPETPQFVVLARGPTQDDLNLDTDDAAHTWLIFDDGAVGSRLAARLEERGQRPVLVGAGDTYEQLESDHFRIDPTRREDFTRVLEESLSEGMPPCRSVVYLWGLTAPDIETITFDSLKSTKQRLANAAMYLVQSLAGQEWSHFPDLWFVTRGAQAVRTESVAVPQALLWGLARVTALEHPELWQGIIDLDPTASSGDVDRLFEEVWAPDDEVQLAFRGPRRYVARLVRNAAPANESGVPRFRPDGAYLITGGLGGLGLATARWMVDHGARRLILMGRTEYPPRTEWQRLIDEGHDLAGRIEGIKSLEANGASVHLAAVDITDEEQFTTYLDQYRREGWPPIRGVVHAAGLIRDDLLIRMNDDTFEAPLAPKVYGAWLLHHHLRDEPLDFFVLYSSASSIVGVFGQANYAAGNAFMDALAHHRRARGLPAQSINWGSWAEIGIVARDNLSDRVAERGIGHIPPDKGLQLVGQLLHANPAQLMVAVIDWDTWAQAEFPLYEEVRHDARGSALSSGSDGEGALVHEVMLLDSEDERREFVASHLSTVTARVLRIDVERFDPFQPLNTLGIDSIMAVELKNYIEGGFGVTLSMVELLQGVSVNDLTEKVLAQMDGRYDDELEDLLAEVEGLSMQETEQLLAGHE